MSDQSAVYDAAPERAHPDGSRALAPHIWQNPDRLSGAPAITGHRIDAKGIYEFWQAGTEWPAIRESYDIIESEYVAAVAFHAGVLWAKEQAEACKAKRRARRWKAGQAAATAKGVNDVE